MENQITIAQPHNKITVMPDKAEWEMLREQATILAKEAGDFLPKTVNTAGKVLAIALVARDLQIPLMQALSSIHIVEGKPTMSGEQMRAMIYERCIGAKIEIKKNDSKGCEIIASRPGQGKTTFSFTEEDARAAGLLNKDNWKKYAADMYLARATARMGRGMFPDIIRGASYVHGELEDAIDITPNKPDKGAEIAAAVAATSNKTPKDPPISAPAPVSADEPSPEQLALPKVQTKEELIKAIGDAGTRLGTTPKQMNTDIETKFKKKPKDLTEAELQEFLTELENRMVVK